MIISYLKKIGIVGLCIWLLTNLIDQSVDISRLLDKHKYSYHSSLKFIKHIDSYFNENVSILSLNMMQEFAYFANGNYDAEIYRMFSMSFTIIAFWENMRFSASSKIIE